MDFQDILGQIRNGTIDRAKAISELDDLLKLCEEHNVKNYKTKILNEKLHLHSKDSKVDQISKVLSQISEVNKQEKFNFNSVKQIITIIRDSNYAKLKQQLREFLEQFDQEIKLRAYLYLFERAIDANDKVQSKELFTKVEGLVEEQENLAAALQLEYYSLDIKYSQLTGSDIADKVHQIELRLPKLEAEAYMSEGYISILKIVIAESMYLSGNYENSAANIFDAFKEKTKYGTSAQLKELLKVNALMCMLIQDPQKRKSDSVNALYHDSSIPFKNETDIQQLITLIDAYENYDINEFNRIYKKVNFKPESPKYLTIENKMLFKMKKEKLLELLKSYQTIKFTYIGRRLSLNEQDVEQIVFELIIDGKIHGRINDSDSKNKCLELLPPRNLYLQIQAENLRQLGKRYLL